MSWFRIRVLLLAVFAALGGTAWAEEGRSQSIDVYAPATWQQPVLIAHRGGVVNDTASENSATAIRLAAEQGFAMIEKLQARGALVIPAINTFRYPSDSHMESAREDIVRMQGAGVDAFQIDAVYSPLFDSDSRSTGGR